MVEIVSVHRCPENSRYGLQLADGARVEAVIYRGDSLCISSQVGCAVSCPFCASGALGLARNLSLAELIGQVDAVLAEHPDITRVTLSGIGEPLHNFDATVGLIDWGRERGLPVSLTTSGGPIDRLRGALALPHRGLTISVHAGFENTRAQLVPRGPSLDRLFEALQATLPSLSRSRRKKLSLAYLLLAGENDGDDEIDAFLARAAPLGLKIQLYAHNATHTHVGGEPRFRTDAERYQNVFVRMCAAGLDVRRSSQARLQANGGCGTLLALGGRGSRRNHRTAQPR